MKVFRGDAMALAAMERNVLTELNHSSVNNIPMFKELYEGADFRALILTPLGMSALPCAVDADVTPRMLVSLLGVIEHVHSLGWIHRDIKPANTYLDQRDNSRIVLNDWSSAARANVECDFVGTRLFCDEPGGSRKHTPEPRLDLRCFVRTAFCLSKQRLPPVDDTPTAVQNHWNRVGEEYPQFSQAMDLANAVNYKQLADLFHKAWW
jgi:serine/threonine protein kinase